MPKLTIEVEYAEEMAPITRVIAEPVVGKK
jgi:hypothetical protein